MFKEFTSALLQKILAHLSKHPDFFAKSKEEREKLLEKLSIPNSFKSYLLDVKAEEFLDHLHTIKKYADGAKDLNLMDNKFFMALVGFLTTDFAGKVDFLDSAFYLLDKKHREKTVNELIKTDSKLAETLRKILLNYTYQQISTEIRKISAKVASSPFILIQTPREMDTEMKREIRKTLEEKYPNSFPTFQINRKLIGGIRIFENGESIDQSWLSRVLRFTSITAV